MSEILNRKQNGFSADHNNIKLTSSLADKIGNILLYDDDAMKMLYVKPWPDVRKSLQWFQNDAH